MNLETSFDRHSNIATDSHLRVIKIEETQAYQRSKQHGVLGFDRQEDRFPQLLKNVIAARGISYKNQLKQHQFDVYHHSTGSFDLIDIHWQGTFKLAQDSLVDRHVIYLVLAGSLNQNNNRHQTYFCSPDTAMMINAGETVESTASEEGEVLLISIDRNAIDSALGKLLDRSLKQPLVFDCSIDLTSEFGMSLKKFVQFLWEAVAQSHSTDFSLLVLEKLEQAFLACIIEGLPNNYSEELQYQQDGALSSHVRKAQIFIDAHLGEDIALGDIADAVGIGARILQKAFSQHCGCSPMRYLTQARLQQIRQELERGRKDTKIFDVMMDYGFSQGGRFAAEYQQLFGEKPSDTLKRSIQSQLNELSSNTIRLGNLADMMAID